MSRAASEMRDFARRLIACDTRGNKGLGRKSPATFQVCEKLRPPLAVLMGNGGFNAMLSRALALAVAEIPAMRAMHVKADGTLDVPEEIQAQLDLDAAFEGPVVLLAHLLGLLVAFIGEGLTIALVREIWPKVVLDNLTLDSGAKK
jgi:hypothetical protein